MYSTCIRFQHFDVDRQRLAPAQRLLRSADVRVHRATHRQARLRRVGHDHPHERHLRRVLVRARRQVSALILHQQHLNCSH